MNTLSWYGVRPMFFSRQTRSAPCPQFSFFPFFTRLPAWETLLLCLTLWSSTVSAQENSLHGALPMKEQVSRLDTLVVKWDVAQPHPKIDPFIWNVVVPEDNQMTPERVDLGRKLYFDTRLSS